MKENISKEHSLSNPPLTDPKWNRFCRKCTIDSQPAKEDEANLHLGTQFTFAVHLDPSAPDDAKPSQAIALEVSALEPIDDNDDGRRGWRIAWRQRPSLMMPSWMLRSERVQEFVEVAAADGGGEPETEYRCWETFYGVLAPVVRLAAAKQVEDGFDAWLAGMKELAEGGGHAAA
jgi:hypothetical protein